MKVKKSSRARGSTRGGCGGGYEHTNPDYLDARLRHMVKEYESLPKKWKRTYLDGLGHFDQNMLLRYIKGQA